MYFHIIIEVFIQSLPIAKRMNNQMKDELAITIHDRHSVQIWNIS